MQSQFYHEWAPVIIIIVFIFAFCHDAPVQPLQPLKLDCFWHYLSAKWEDLKLRYFDYPCMTNASLSQIYSMSNALQNFNQFEQL